MNTEKPVTAQNLARFARTLARTSRITLLPLSLTLAAGDAFGQDKPVDPAAAEALYLTGRKLVNDGDWAGGCEKFRASMELNPAASTLINIAKCNEHDGKLTQAMVDYKRALQLNQDTLGAERKKALEELAKEGMATIEPRLARVELSVKTRPEGLKVSRDGISIPLAALGVAIPLDPGAHTFEASAPGYAKEEKRLELKEGEHATVELSLTPAAADDKSTPDKPKPIPDKRSGGAPVWAYVAGGVGVAAIGGSVYFLLDQLDAEAQLKKNCGEALQCDPSGPYDPTNDNNRKNTGFALFVGLGAAGIVGVGAAVIGFVRGSGPKKAATPSGLVVSPIVGRSEGGFVVQGAF